jgi:hypothetical protein
MHKLKYFTLLNRSLKKLQRSLYRSLFLKQIFAIFVSKPIVNSITHIFWLLFDITKSGRSLQPVITDGLSKPEMSA